MVINEFLEFTYFGITRKDEFVLKLQLPCCWGKFKTKMKINDRKFRKFKIDRFTLTHF